MKKTALFFAVVMTATLLTGCFAKPLEITFLNEAYSYLNPAEDTLNIATSANTNLYISKVICAEEAVLDAGGPALQSAYAKPTDATPSNAFTLSLDRLDKFDGMLCDIYVMAYDETTIEETEASVRVNIGVEGVVVAEEEVCEDGTVCVDEDAEAEVEEVVVEETVTE